MKTRKFSFRDVLQFTHYTPEVSQFIRLSMPLSERLPVNSLIHVLIPNYFHPEFFNIFARSWQSARRRKYHVSCEPLRIFWKDDTTCSTWVPCVLPTTGWIPGFSACSGQHAWHSCRAGCIVISENPQGLATHMVHGDLNARNAFYQMGSDLSARNPT